MDIRSDIDVPNLDELTVSVIETLTPKEVEVQDKRGHWYSLQIRPYRTTDDKIDGAVIVLADIDEAKQASERIRKSKLFMEETLATVREPLVVLRQDLTVLYVNPSFLKTFKVRTEDTEGKLLYNLGNEQWNIPRLREMLEEVLSRDAPVIDFEVQHDFPELGRKIMLLNATKIEDGHNDVPLMLLAIEDITDRKRTEGCGAIGSDRRIIRRRHDQQNARRHDHELEQRRRAVIRIYGRGSDWPKHHAHHSF